MLSVSTLCDMSSIYLDRGEMLLADTYCQEAVSYARLCEGQEEKRLIYYVKL